MSNVNIYICISYMGKKKVTKYFFGGGRGGANLDSYAINLKEHLVIIYQKDFSIRAAFNSV